jgi:tRNA/tmRNA/rRNA uracil-C5-methylase (TrmA/RlmC/RlmD family)
MDNLFDKLSTLVNAQLNEFLGKNPTSPLARIRLDAEDAEQHPRRTFQAIRERLDEAMRYEDQLQAKIDKLMQSVIRLDEQVDAMVQANDVVGARRMQVQLNMKQQQLAIAESELRDHRTLSQHLMQEMTTLEMALDSQKRASQAPPETSPNRKVSIPVDDADSQPDDTVIDVVTGKLQQARDSLDHLLNNSPVPSASDVSERFENIDIIDEVPDPRQPKSRKSDADMARRLSRLSKPDDET